MGEQCEEGGERAESGGEEDEEWELLLGVDGHLVERRQQLPVSALRATAKERERVKFSATNTRNSRNQNCNCFSNSTLL